MIAIRDSQRPDLVLLASPPENRTLGSIVEAVSTQVMILWSDTCGWNSDCRDDIEVLGGRGSVCIGSSFPAGAGLKDTDY
jgi:hypothetical protein